VRRHPRLFEISAWPWLERLSRRDSRHVTLADVPAADWDAIARRRFDILFLMGVWQRSAIGRDIARSDAQLVAEYHRVLPGWTPDDVPGSPYCIQAYVPDERMGGWSGLDEARRQLHARGIALMVDFVPNHTGFDHPWVASHPERYVLGTDDDVQAAPMDFRRVGPASIACGRDPYFAPWRDVAQLNYFNPDTRAAMRATLNEIEAHCDGVRCDMAMLVLNDVFEHTWRRVLRDAWPRPDDEFWPAATAGAPGLTFLAEVYWSLERTVLDQGFHFAYDKRFLDALHSQDAGAEMRRVLEATASDAERLARFLENHDEPRSAATLADRLRAAVALAASTPGMQFFYDGQFDGRRAKAPVQLGRWPDEPVNGELTVLYDRTFAFADRTRCHEGEWRLLPVSPAGDDSHRGIVAHRWLRDGSVTVIVANPVGHSSQAHVHLLDDLGAGDAFDFQDHLNGETYRWTRESLERTGLYVRLGPGGAHLFTVRAVEA
jgi:glycosidase